ncbi:MAG: hypothetical protein HEQ27_01610 [Dolichospermum sp. JUN01]|nr:hypothetical protein [Dolichospermum sp. JUN01]
MRFGSVFLAATLVLAGVFVFIAVNKASIEQQKATKATEKANIEQQKATEATNKSEQATKKLTSTNKRLAKVNQQMQGQKQEGERAKKNLEKQNNKLTNDSEKLQREIQSKSREINLAQNKVKLFQDQQTKIQAKVKQKEKELKLANRNTNELKNSIAKITELSAVASKLQQKGKNNEANQFLNIAGLVLQNKIKNPELKAALLDSSLVLGYESLKTEEEKNTQLESQYNKAKEDLNKSFEKLPKENNIDKNDSSYLATLVYIYYVKGKLGKSLNNYKIASDKYNLLKSQLESSNTNLFKLDLNILYNGNADIVALLYRQLNDLDSSNTVYYEFLKAHLLDELDYLMQQNNRWQDADSKNWQFILVSAKREKEGYLELNNIKNFNCKDLKAVDELWVKNSKGKFGFSVQKKIYIETGNSLDFDWEKGTFTKFSNERYDRFAERVGWKKGKEEGGKWMGYGEIPLWAEANLDKYKWIGTLPSVRWIFYDAGLPRESEKWRRERYSSLLAETCRL